MDKSKVARFFMAHDVVMLSWGLIFMQQEW